MHMTEIWQPAKFLIAELDGPSDRNGYVYRGLGLHMIMKASPKGRRPPRWRLTHLGSGHSIGIVDGNVADAFPIAAEIAECADWTFDGIDGWKNIEPDLPQRYRSIAEKHKKRLRITAGGGANREVARAIAMSRSP